MGQNCLESLHAIYNNLENGTYEMDQLEDQIGNSGIEQSHGDISNIGIPHL